MTTTKYLTVDTFKTQDGQDVRFTRSRHDPNYLESGGMPGMAPCMDYPYISLPGQPWIKCNARSQLQTKNAIETNTLADIEAFIREGLI
jgi:hypothetical protein